jgi:hypothetical protein
MRPEYAGKELLFPHLGAHEQGQETHARGRGRGARAREEEGDEEGEEVDRCC